MPQAPQMRPGEAVRGGVSRAGPLGRTPGTPHTGPAGGGGPPSTYDVHEPLGVADFLSTWDGIFQPLGQAQGRQQQPHLTCPQHLGDSGAGWAGLWVLQRHKEHRAAPAQPKPEAATASRCLQPPGQFGTHPKPLLLTIPIQSSSSCGVGQAASHRPLPGKSIRVLSGKSSGFQEKHFRGRILLQKGGAVSELHPAGASLLHPCPGCFIAPCQVLLDCPAICSTQPGHSRLKDRVSKVHFPDDRVAGAKDGSLPPRVCFPSSLIARKAFLGCSGKRQHHLTAEHHVGHRKAPSHPGKQSAHSGLALCSSPPPPPRCLHLHVQVRRGVLR